MRLLRLVLAVAGLLAAASSSQAQVTNAATTNLSSTIVTGNTFQGITGLAAIAAGGGPRRSVTIQNNNTTDSCWLYIGATANATKALAILLTAGQAYTRYFPYVPSDNFAITCTTTSDTFYADIQ